ncbi:MAG: TonB-dependent receptor plug domain-containing protein, partial [Prevotella sp.]|nr:TonB-dependent receptor plug domain-containing protein [Prevotella sp.]
MRIKLILLMLMLVSGFPVFAQSADSTKIKLVELDSITITGDSYKKAGNRNSALSVEVVDKDFLRQHFTGNLVQSLEHISGIRSMDIGSGFSKPMIRGMAFNRVSVIENGIKQEGQQWGSDHGLEIDAFDVERVIVRKGPVSLLYGSDAMGGAIEISRSPAPAENRLFGEVVLLTKTVNGTLGGSVMLGLKKDAWHAKIRYTEQHFGDFRVPSDSIVYLTMRIPLYGR